MKLIQSKSLLFGLILSAFLLAGSAVYAATMVTNTTPGGVPTNVPTGGGQFAWNFTASADTNFGEGVCVEVQAAGQFASFPCDYVSGSNPTNWSCDVDMTSNAAFANTTVTYQFFAAGFGACNSGQNSFTDFVYSFDSGPTAVELSSFAAEAQSDGSVAVNWTTAAEWDHAGFNVYRSDSADGALTQVNADIVAATGIQGQGASYSLADVDVTPGTVWYTLEDVDINGYRTQHGPVSVTVSAPTAVGLSAQAANAGTLLLVLLPMLGLAGLSFGLRRR